MAEPNPDLVFLSKLMDDRENAKPLEQRFEEKRKGFLQSFRDWTDDGWARGWQRTYKVLPVDHANIIYWHAMGVGMVELSLGYKLSSSTVFGHIHAHNTQVTKHGACERCIRAFRNISRDADLTCLVESEVTLGSELRWELEVLSKASRDEELDLIDDRYKAVEQRYWLARSSGSIE